VRALIEERASSALATWGAPTLTAEYDQRMTAATLADWAAALADDSATSDARVVALRDENARKQQIIDEWVERAFELQATAWKHATAEQGLSAALADSEARLALIHKQQATIADLTEQRDRYLHESDDRLSIIRRIETLLQQAIAERDRYAAESAERLALIRREQARLAALRPR
jgi:hypothetical protein